MKIRKFYRIAGIIIGISLSLLSLILTVPIFFSLFGLGLFASSKAIIPIVVGPLIIFVVIIFICSYIGSKIGSRYEIDLQNIESDEKRAKNVLLISILLSLLGIVAFLFGISKLLSFYKSIGEEGRKNIEAGIEREKSHEQYAVIGDVSFELQEPFSEPRGIDGKLIEVSMFKKLVLVIPVSVSQAGTYQIHAQYSDSEVGGTPMKDVVQTFTVGANTVRVEFLTSESRERGYFSPESTKGTAQIQLSYVAFKKELVESSKSSGIDQKILEQFMKDEGVSANSGVNKFVERKEVQF